MSFFAEARGLGKVLGPDSLIHLAPGRKCAPDVFFIRQERVPMPLPKEFEGVPELVVEVLSPSNRRYDLRDKRQIYREAGVGEVWFIDAELRRILVDRRQAGSYVEEIMTAGQVVSEVMPGLLVERFLAVGAHRCRTVSGVWKRFCAPHRRPPFPATLTAPGARRWRHRFSVARWLPPCRSWQRQKDLTLLAFSAKLRAA